MLYFSAVRAIPFLLHKIIDVPTVHAIYMFYHHLFEKGSSHSNCDMFSTG